MKIISQLLWLTSLLFVLSGCVTTPEPTPVQKPKPKTISKYHSLRVTATAYTSSRSQTDRTPFLAAWMNKLKPGVKSIAVSRDLLKMGLGNGTVVTIDGFSHKYKVLDKMNKRWRKKIDIYMGTNRRRALRWGKKGVTIRWAKTSEELKKEYAAVEAKRLEEEQKQSMFYYLRSLFDKSKTS